MICSEDIVIDLEMLLHLEMSSKPEMTIFQHKDYYCHIESNAEHNVPDIKQPTWLSCATHNGFNCC